MKRFLYALCLLFPFPALADTVPAEMKAALSRGINTETWMESDKPGRYRLSDDDVQRIADVGFKHVRLAFEPGLLLMDQDKALARLDDAIASINKANMLVIIDYHPGGFLPPELKTDPVARQKMTLKLWQILATHLASTDPSKVAVELYNEPQENGADWQPRMEEIFKLVRGILPNHTIIIQGAVSSNLTQLKPVDDGNVVYAFHFYNDLMFTHQGGKWKNSAYFSLKNVPFPPRMTDDMAALIGKLKASDNPKLANRLGTYLSSGIDMDELGRRLQARADWAKKHNAFVIMDEFGVTLNGPAEEDRLLWLRTVREAAEARGIGWTVWDHGSNFAVFRQLPGLWWQADGKVLQALGL